MKWFLLGFAIAWLPCAAWFGYLLYVAPTIEEE